MRLCKCVFVCRLRKQEELKARVDKIRREHIRSKFPVIVKVRYVDGHVFNQSINQSFICSDQYKKQVNAQYSVERDTKA